MKLDKGKQREVRLHVELTMISSGGSKRGVNKMRIDTVRKDNSVTKN